MKNLSVIYELLKKEGLSSSGRFALHVEKMAGDGSSRKFWRISDGEQKLCLAVAPPNTDEPNMAEASAARAIGLHLLSKEIPVPEQYAWDEESGILLFEDLGDCKLHDFVLQKRKEGTADTSIRDLYKQVLVSLTKMQVAGAESFNPEWCWDTPEYDKKLMLERESGYFLRAFWQGVLGKDVPDGLQEEFEQLASQAALISVDYFLHRDFQSRNIMINEEKPVFIDFQGGRMGPLGYDLASLLNDPYVALSIDFQEELLNFYADILLTSMDVSRDQFVQDYALLALHRNLQIIGAFAFLSEQCGKVFFRQFLQPALASLQRIVEKPLFAEYAVLRKCVKGSRQEFLKWV